MKDPMDLYFEQPDKAGMKVSYPKDEDFPLKVGYALWLLHMNDLMTFKESVNIRERYFKKMHKYMEGKDEM